MDLWVLHNATADSPYTFKAADFKFTDPDGDELASITIKTLPSLGTLRVGRSAATVGQNVAAASIGTITYYPASGQRAQVDYTTFTYSVTAGNEESGTGTVTIHLRASEQVPATGTPVIADEDFDFTDKSTINEDALYTASLRPHLAENVQDLNGGISLGTLNWEWQQSATQDGTYTEITEVGILSLTGATFIPRHPHVGQYVRVCATFMDEHSPPGSEERCSPGALVLDVSDRPVGSDSTVGVPSTASSTAPHRFSRADFPLTDEDGDTINGIRITALPAKGTLVLVGDSSTTIAIDTELTLAQLDTLAYYPDASAPVGVNYATFTYRVRDTGDVSTTVTICKYGDASFSATCVPVAGSTNEAAADSTITIDIANASQAAARGAPLVAATDAAATAHDEDVPLAASTSGITEPNGINNATVQWQWYQAAAPATGTPEDGDYRPIAGATAATFTPLQEHVGMYIRVCAFFMDNHATPASEGGTTAAPTLCSTAAQIANTNDAPQASDHTHTAARTGDSDIIIIPASAFQAAYNDPDGDDLASVIITAQPDSADGTLRFGGSPITINQPLALKADGTAFAGDNQLTFTLAEGTQTITIDFRLNDGQANSVIATLTITLGQDIPEEQTTQINAILTTAAITNATSAIGGAITSAPTTDLSIDGTSLMGTAQKLGQSKTADSPHHAWYLGTTANWEYNAAYNASDNSRASLLNRLNAMASGDIALNYSLTDTSTMRFWARYQSLDINGNEGESLEYDGSGTGFYIGADNQITDTMRIGLAIGTDSSDISIDLDDDKTNAKDEATRSATSFYPYLHIDLGNNNNARVIAGFGSGTLDIKSTANSNSTASADLSWNMLAASISHHRQMKGNLSARFDGSLQLGNTSVDETTFTSGSTLMAADSSTNELSINAELRYQKNNITPFASLAARKLGGDLSQSVALDMAFGADLQTNPANLRIAITRQINDTTHQRHSISLDASTNPGASGISASLGSRYDSITGRPQWQSTIGWQRKRFQTSLQASPGDYRLRARLRW